MSRLFIGIEIPKEIKNQLSFTVKSKISGARWVLENQHHLTLLFLGELHSNQYASVVEHVQSVASEAYPFEIKLQGVDIFGSSKSPKVIYLAVQKNEDLILLQEKIEKKFRQDSFKFESKKFVPHVTLARLNRPDTLSLGVFLQEYSLTSFNPFLVKHVVIFESQLNENGVTYLVRERIDLI